MPIFGRIVAKQCGPACTSYRQQVVHGDFFEQCGEPLTAVFGWNLRLIVLAVGGPVVLVPQPLNEEGRTRAEAWVRNADRDQIITQQKASLAGLVRRDRLDARAVAGFVADLRRRLGGGRKCNECGHELAREGGYGEARQEFRRAVESDPENAAALVGKPGGFK